MIPLQRAKTSTSTPSAPSAPAPATPAQTETTKSLAWLQLHENSPVSYGIQAFDGYLELVPPKTPLPCEKSAKMESALDYVKGVSFQVACRGNVFDIPVNIGEAANLQEVRFAREGEAEFKVTMWIQKDLSGELIAQDTWTRSMVSIEFDGGGQRQFWPDHQRLIGTKT